jgi:hypothetical protein
MYVGYVCDDGEGKVRKLCQKLTRVKSHEGRKSVVALDKIFSTARTVVIFTHHLDLQPKIFRVNSFTAIAGKLYLCGMNF